MRIALKVGDVSATVSEEKSSSESIDIDPKTLFNTQENETKPIDKMDYKTPEKLNSETIEADEFSSMDIKESILQPNTERTVQKVYHKNHNKLSEYKYGVLKQSDKKEVKNKKSKVKYVTIEEVVEINDDDLKEIKNSKTDKTRDKDKKDIKNDENPKKDTEVPLTWLPDGLESAEWLNQAVKVIYFWYAEK